MSIDIETYRLKAQEAIEYVFVKEYHNSLGIPMPIVKMLLPDDANYSTGQYYITIDKTWQIHLNFGKLPISYHEFQNEVKVLTRHEIEHYMCCPFDVITHFRMLKRIRDVYYKHFSHLSINIEHACGAISNQAADIIVDTKNYYRHSTETLKSEINWIKIGANISDCPKHCKLMFLTKEAIWKEDLGINETDSDLLKIVHQLADSFTKTSIEDKTTFLDKVEEYAEIFFKLYIEDQKKPQHSSQQGSQHLNCQQGTQQQGGGQGAQQLNDQQESQQHSGQQGSQHQCGQQESQQQDGQQGVGRPKDGDEHGNTFIFADPDKVKEAIEALAEETSVAEFIDLLTIAGIVGLSDKQKETLWFNVQSANIIPIVESSNTGNKSSYTYPSAWRIGDPIEELDLMLTYMTSPRLIPGMTTKKWEYISNDDNGTESKQIDLLLVVDTSGSMGSAMKESDNMHQAVLASYGILSYFESTKSKVALIEFSDKIDACVDWTDKYDVVKERLLTNGHGGTKFPISRIKLTLDAKSSDLVTVLITDGDLDNINESVSYFRDYLNDDNKLYIFLLGGSKSLHSYEPLKNIGAKIYNATNANEFCNMVLTDME